VNTVTVRGRRTPKRPPFASSTLTHDAAKKILVSDDLPHRWEQIVAKGRA
jgi:hypothetical protein